VLRRGVLLPLLAAALIPASAQASVQAVKVGSFSRPIYVTAPPGDQHRLMVVEQAGRIQEIVDGQRQAAPFLDISGEVTAPSGGEQGLLSMAFAPDYATSGRFYVYYTSKNCPSSPGCDEHVSEFTRSASNPNVADPGSERLLLTIPHPGDSNHNGGQLQFGPDGELYISTGDGGGSNDQHQNAQKTDASHLLGKILRMNPTSSTPYAGNPFGSDDPIWAYGLRNPWRFSFDRATGDMIIGDVGQSAWEEIDFSPPGQNAGANYGWSCYEGSHVNTSAQDLCSPEPSPVVNPVFQYSHSCSVTPAFCGAGIIGGYVVRDPSLPDLNGRYIYGDLSTSASKGLRSISLPAANDDAPVPVNIPYLSSFGEDAAGCIYAASVGNGSVYRLASTPTVSTVPCGPAPPAPPAGDRTAPTVRISLRRRQRFLRAHVVKIAVRVSEPSALSATVSLKTSRLAKTINFKRVRRNLAAGKRLTLKLHLSKSSLRKLRRAFRHHRSFMAKVAVTARDAAGNTGGARRAVRLLR
jgi:glucose/arabinose dehydrogenase